jgi:hypothetical protein
VLEVFLQLQRLAGHLTYLLDAALFIRSRKALASAGSALSDFLLNTRHRRWVSCIPWAATNFLSLLLGYHETINRDIKDANLDHNQP